MVSQLIVIDSRVRNHQFVIDQISAGFAVLELDANTDGLAQIANYLLSHSSANASEAFSAIHLLSHGSEGETQLGSLTLDSTNLAAEAQMLARIHSLLAPGADLLMYGCDVARGAQGSAFVTQLAKVSGLDVAASTNLTGGTKGDWVLETTVGQLQAQALRLNLQDSLLAGPPINGTNGNDTLTGTTADETIKGLGGDDWIEVSSVSNASASFGSDNVDGGSGADWISFTNVASAPVTVNLADHTATSTRGSVALTSIEKVAGTSGADSLTGGDAANQTDAIGNRVTEWFRGNGGNDAITGGAGRDFAAASDYSNNSSSQAVSANLSKGVALDGLGGTDTLVNIDFLVGGAGNDSLTGGSLSRDPLGNFYEMFRGNAGNDTLDGSNSTSDGDYASSDRADYSRNSTTQAVIFNLSAQSLTAGSKTVAAGKADDGMGGTDTLISIDQVYGGSGNDTFVGGSGGETFDGGAGNDSMDGGGGSDQVRFQQATAGVVVNLSATSLTVGAKTVAAGSADDGMGGTDTLVNIENVRGSDYSDYIRGSDDTSTRQYLGGDAGSDTIDGGLGVDIASYGDTPLSLGGITASLVAGTDGVVRITDKKGGVDTLINIEGLSGTHSADSLTGSSGNDYLRGQGGSDTLDGGAGNDWVLYNADPSSVTINLQTGQATDGWNGAAKLLALGGTDTLKNIENAEGSDFNDSVTGSDGDNQLVGRAGSDNLSGGGGNDSLLGGEGRDTLDGGLGNDTLDGGTITDTLNLDDLNIASYASATGAIAVNLDTGTSSGAAGNDVLRNINMVIGCTAADTLTGSNRTEFAEFFEGGAGNDTIDGLGGNFDVAVYSSATAAVTVNLSTGVATGTSTGTDTLRNIEAVFGSNSSDSLTGGSNSSMTSELFRGNGGNDTIDGGSGYDWAFYDTGATGVVVTLGDTVDGSASDGLGGTDVLRSIEGVRGSAFGDTLTGSNRTDSTENFEGREGNDLIDGKGGLDTAWYKNSRAGVDVDLSQGKATNDGYGTSDTLTNIENVYGSRDFNDLIKGNAGDNRLEGNGGNDTLMGGAGEDYILGGTGNDSIDGGTNTAPYSYDWASYEAATGAVQVSLSSGQSSGADGNDTLTGIEAIAGSSFADTITGDANINVLRGNGGDDTIDGGDGFDIANYYRASGSVTVSLLTNTSSGADGADTLIRIEGLSGSQYNDTLTGDANNNWIAGNAGDDSLVGGAGTDTAHYHRASGGVTVNLATGIATGTDGNDTLTGFENISGTLLYADSLTGSDGNNWIEGNGGNDTLVGAGGNDTLLGGSGNDSLDGGAGYDVLDYGQDTAGVAINLQTQRATDGYGGQDTLAGFEEVRGSAFNDSITGSNNLYKEVFVGGLGNDTIDGGAITDTLNVSNSNVVSYQFASGAVNVSLGLALGTSSPTMPAGTATGTTGATSSGTSGATGATGNSAIGAGRATGADGTDVLYNIDVAVGSAYDDTITGSSRTDIREVFKGGGGNDTIDGGGGYYDLADFSDAAGGITVSMAGGGNGTATGAGVGTDTLKSIEGIIGSNYADLITGSAYTGNTLAGSELFRGNGGNDTIDGGAGFDWAFYDTSTAGVVVTLGGSADGTAQDGLGGTDLLRNIEAVRGSDLGDTLTGSSWNEYFEGRAGNDVIDGQGGVDTAYYFRSVGGVNVDLSQNKASNDGYGSSDTLLNIENVVGSRDSNDAITGNSGDNRLEGNGGNDTLNGGAGTDTLIGGDGNDVITVTDTGSTDSIDGGAGWDNLTLRMGTGTLALNGGNMLGIESYNLDITTGSGTTAPTVTVLDTVFAAATANTVSVSSWGANAALNIDASAAAVGHNVNLNGGNGNDTLVGGAGDDTLWGGTGNDSLNGGAGNDTANYNFDQTQLSGLALSGGNGTWTLSGSSALLKLQANANGTWTVTDLRTNSAISASNSGPSGIDTLNGIETIHLDVRDSNGTSVSAANMDLRINGGTSSVSLRDVSTFGTTGSDSLTGTSGNDTISAYSGADTITALGGDDQITVTDNGTTDSIDGGAGYDTLSLQLDGTALNLGANADIKGIENYNLYGNYTGSAVQAVTLSDALFTTTTGTTVSVNTWTTSATLNINASTVLAGHSVKLYGSIGNDTLVGGAGDDFLNGGSGSDSLLGGDGNDTLTGFGMSGTLDGGSGIDTWLGDVGPNRLDSATLTGDANNGWSFALGNGYVIGLIKPIVGSGSWTLKQTGSDTVKTMSNIEFMQITGIDANGAPMTLKIAVDNSLTAPTLTIIRAPSQGNDSLLGTSGNDTINGQGGDDTIDGAAGNDLLLGGDGRDALIGGAGNDTLDGGSGRDTVYYGSALQGVTVNLVTWWGTVDGTASDGQGGTDVLRSLEQVIGSAYADDLTVGRFGAADGGAGNDVLRSGNGTALLYGGAGNDTIVGSVDVDVAGFTLGSSRVDGLTVSGSAAVGWTVSAQGVNLMGLTYNSTTSKWTASDLRTGSTTNSSFGTDTLQSVEYLQLDGTGTNGTNSAFLKLTSGASPTVGVASVITNSSTYVGWGGQNMTGSNADDLMYGGDDNDTLIGGNGNDVLLGGYGGDRFIGGAGDDTLSGGYQTNVSWRFGRGNNFNDWDTADYTGTTTAGISLDLSTMKATGLAGANTGTDTLRGIEQLSMTRQHDEVVGTLATLSGNNELGGDQHALSVVGYGGSDSFSDTLHTNTPWQDMDIEYWWSKTAINVTLTGSTGTVSYGAAGTLGSADYQAAGVDTLSRISEFGDSNFSDTFNFKNQTENAAVGQKWAWVHLSLGNDTVVGNGETSVSFSPWGNMQSSTGKGIYVQLGAPGVTTTVNLTHLTLNATAMGTATLTDVNGVTGTNFDDTLMGSAGNDHLDGRGGNDLLDGGAGWDKANYLYSSTTGIAVNMQAGTVSGRDTADTSVGYDTLRSIEMVQGTNLDDLYDATGFSGTSVNAGSDGQWNQFEGNGGNDTIIGNGASSISYGFSSTAVDVNLGTGQAKALDPANQTGELAQIVGNDTFSGVYQVVGSVLGDKLTGGGAGRTEGAGAYEIFRPGAGNDTVDGQGGWDAVTYSDATSAITADLNLATGQVQDGMGGTDTLVNIEGVFGSKFNDVLLGSDANNNPFKTETFAGGMGNDTIDGRGGFDKVYYGYDNPGAGGGGSTTPKASTSTIKVVDGPIRGAKVYVDMNDNGIVDQSDRLIGATDASGSLVVTTDSLAQHGLLAVGGTNDNGMPNASTLSLAALPDNVRPLVGTGVNVNLATGVAQDGFGTVDTLTNIEGVIGSQMDDVLTGNAGDNRLDGRGGNDTLDGGAGSDWADYDATTAGAVQVNLATGQAAGGAGNDTLINIENVLGSVFDDTLTGNASANRLQGGAGNDTLIGGGGTVNDTAVCTGAYANYTVTRTANGWTVKDNVGNEGTDTLTGIERIAFADQTIIANNAPTGLVKISGTATQNKTLTASNTVADVDGIGAITYQWSADGMDINGATSATLRLTQAQVGKVIAVTARYTDGTGTAESVSSANTKAVLNVNDLPTGGVSVDVSDGGPLQQGATLTASNNLADDDGMGTVSYQWFSAETGVITAASGAAIFGTNGSSLTLGQGQVGQHIYAKASYTDGGGKLESKASGTTGVVANTNDAPTGSATITGNAWDGQTLTAQSAIADADGLGDLQYQWLVDGQVIEEANASTLVLTPDLIGHTIAVQLSYLDGGDTEEMVESAPTDEIAPKDTGFTGDVKVTGTLAQYQVLHAQANLQDDDGMGILSYQWKANGVNITGATAETLTLSQAQVDKKISVSTSYTDGHGNLTSVDSALSATVANVNDAPTGLVSISGTAKKGMTLTAKDTLTDQDGLGTISYQWKSNGVNIAGAINPTFVVTQAQVATKITVTASYTDVFGAKESKTSLSTVAVVNVNTAPVISSDATVSFSENGSGVAYTTVASDADPGTVLKFTLGGADATLFNINASTGAVSFKAAPDYEAPKDAGANNVYDVTVTASDGSLSASKAVAITVSNVNEAPVNTLPTATQTTLEDTSKGITGLQISDVDAGSANFSVKLEAVNGTLTVGSAAGVSVASNNTASVTLTGTLAAVNSLLSSSNAVTYVPTANFNGATAKLTITTNDGSGGTDTDSLAITVTPVNDQPTGGVTIAGNAVLNGTLTASNTLADADVMGVLAYQWLSDGTAITGATANTFTMLAAQVNRSISLRVSYTDAGGTNESVTSGILRVGSASADTIVGGDGADSISGGAGNDLLTGGKGNDTLDGGVDSDTANYASASAAITVNLAATSANGTASSTAANDVAAIGTDTLKNIENVVGSGFGDSLTGDANANVLYGKLGNDTLTGGAGADVFVFDTATGSTNVDTIKDFTSASDKIQLSKTIFAAAGNMGALLEAAFGSGAGVVAGRDADDRFVYNTSNGNLYYDSDGNGAAAAVLIATLGTTTPPTLRYSDLQIIG